jgi:TonB-linked SusC/RagA family outer membrane protein
MRKLLLFCSLLVLIASGAYAQSRQISGAVTDKDSNPLAGVTVSVLATQKGTLTDIKGHFKIQAETGQVLQFSYVGYKPVNVKVGEKTSNINIQVTQELTDLNEVVVTGYTSEKKRDLTGAVTVVNINDIKDVPTGNAMQALQGRVPGLQIANSGNPNGAVGVTLRGITTLNDNDPLYIIDGIPTQRGLQEINQDDIASIQVLKDASSSSIYGSRAAAGVIIITTKKGKEGRQRIDFDASTSIQYYNSKISALNTIQHGQAYWQAQVNDDEFGPNVGNPVNPVEYAVNGGPGGVYTFNWNHNYSNPILYGVHVSKYLDTPNMTMLSSNTNWFNQISQPSIQQKYDLTISSGTDHSNSLFSVGYFDNRGIIKDTRDTKYNVRYNNDYSFFNGKLKIGETLSGTYMRDPILPVSNITSLALIENPIIPVYTTTGGWGGPINGMDDRDNPYREIIDNQQNVNAFGRVFGNAYISYAILPNLNFKTTYAADFAGNYLRSVQIPYVAGFLSDTRTIAAASSDYELTETWQNQLTYDLSLGKNKFNFLLGEENVKDKNQNFNASAQGLTLSTIDYAYLSAGTTNYAVAGAGSSDALLSYFTKVNYSYDDKYLASATLRRDGSSRFGQDNRYAYFPAGSVGWRISQESFIKDNAPFISDLKLRYGWGQTGNQNISDNGIYSLYQSIYGNRAAFNGDSGSAYAISGQGSGTLPSGFTAVQTGNPQLKWETTTQSNFGLDFGFFNNKLTGSADYYIKKTTDILITPPYLAVLGEGGNETYNGASMQDKGLELQLNYSGNISHDITFNLAGNIAGYRNKVLSLPSDVLNAYAGNGTTQTVLGRDINSEYGYVVQGIFQNQAEVNNSATQPGKGVGRLRYEDLNHDGVIDQNDETFIGNPDPNFVYGLNTSVGYKGFNLTFFFQGSQGGLVDNTYKTLTDFTSLAPGSNWGTRVLDAWTPTNNKSTIPALTLNDNNNEGRPSTYFLESGSYLKLRNIQLSYNLKNAIKKLKLQRAMVYIQASNLLTFKSASYTAPDPENPGNAYPIPVITTIGINFSY